MAGIIRSYAQRATLSRRARPRPRPWCSGSTLICSMWAQPRGCRRPRSQGHDRPARPGGAPLHPSGTTPTSDRSLGMDKRHHPRRLRPGPHRPGRAHPPRCHPHRSGERTGGPSPGMRSCGTRGSWHGASPPSRPSVGHGLRPLPPAISRDCPLDPLPDHGPPPAPPGPGPPRAQNDPVRSASRPARGGGGRPGPGHGRGRRWC